MKLLIGIIMAALVIGFVISVMYQESKPRELNDKEEAFQKQLNDYQDRDILEE